MNAAETLFFSLSVIVGFRLTPAISIQNEEVSAVIAPSALGKNAEISAIINMMESA